MSAIITDQLRILNAKKFVSEVKSDTNSYYTFLGLPNATDYKDTWDVSPQSPIDNFDYSNDVWDTIISLKKIKSDDITLVIRKTLWQSGTVYSMYRNDISRNNVSAPSNITSLYQSNYYVINPSTYRVYICLNNGTSPETPYGKPSLDVPNFVDIEPSSAGSSGDGYVWKYLYTIKPSDLIKFDTTNFAPVPYDWSTNSEYSAVRSNASVANNQLKIITIRSRGVGVGNANQVYTNVPIKGDGIGATATVITNNESKLDSILISNGGDNYTYAHVDFAAAGITYTTKPEVDVIIPPSGGHGYDILRELGASNVLIYTRFSNEELEPDYVIGNKFARIGIISNPEKYASNDLLTSSTASGTYALRLTGAISDLNILPNSYITQTVSVGQTAAGRVVSYDNTTGVLKYWQDRTIVGFNYGGEYGDTINPISGTNRKTETTPLFGYSLNRFTSNVGTGGSTTIKNINLSSLNVAIDNTYTGITTTILNKTYNLGQFFENGVSTPEPKKYSGNIIHLDNRPSILRNINQKEDIKIILQF